MSEGEEWLWRVDVDALRYLSERAEARLLKRELIKDGYWCQLSLYGVLTDVTTDSSQYRRIEVFKDRLWDEKSVTYVREYFVLFPPEVRYSIYQYRSYDDNMRVMGEFN